MPPKFSRLRRSLGLLTTAAALSLGAATLWHSNTSHATVRMDHKPITIVVTFPPGGGTDMLARKLGSALQLRTGQPVVVDNRPGASGNIGARIVAGAAPDGHTLLMVNSSFAINPAVFTKLDFDPLHDFTGVLNVGSIASVLVVPATSPHANLKTALASSSTAQPLAFASCGNGTPQHMAGEMLAQAIQVPLQHVPYKGCGPAMTAVAAGQVPMAVVTASSAAPLLEAGQVRALGITTPQRIKQWPHIPTVAEQVAPGYAVEQWHGLLAPSGIAPEVREHLHQAFAEVLADPVLIQELQRMGYTVAHTSADAFNQLVISDIRRFTQVSQALGLRVD